MESGSVIDGGAPSGGAAAWERLRSAGARLVDLPGLAGLLLTLAAWSGAAALLGPALPPPHAVLADAATNLLASDRLPGIGLPRGGYFPHLVSTARTVLLGGSLGAVAGMATGLASAESRLVADALAPVVSLLGTIPIVILAPFFLIWFGLSGAAQIALVAIYTATVLHLFTLRGVRNIPASYFDYAATLGATPAQRFLAVCLPGAMPEIFGGLRIACAAAWGLAAVTEMLGGQYGCGRVLVALRSVYDLTGIMAVVLLLSVLAIALDQAVVALRAVTLRWSDPASATGGRR
jgi:ABC-type nitrate/sulfonate/bicarbonate transport system permease component